MIWTGQGPSLASIAIDILVRLVLKLFFGSWVRCRVPVLRIPVLQGFCAWHPMPKSNHGPAPHLTAVPASSENRQYSCYGITSLPNLGLRVTIKLSY